VEYLVLSASTLLIPLGSAYNMGWDLASFVTLYSLVLFVSTHSEDIRNIR